MRPTAAPTFPRAAPTARHPSCVRPPSLADGAKGALPAGFLREARRAAPIASGDFPSPGPRPPAAARPRAPRSTDLDRGMSSDSHTNTKAPAGDSHPPVALPSSAVSDLRLSPPRSAIARRGGEALLAPTPDGPPGSDLRGRGERSAIPASRPRGGPLAFSCDQSDGRAARAAQAAATASQEAVAITTSDSRPPALAGDPDNDPGAALLLRVQPAARRSTGHTDLRHLAGPFSGREGESAKDQTGPLPVGRGGNATRPTRSELNDV
jgi:hypothetical protein